MLYSPQTLSMLTDMNTIKQKGTTNVRINDSEAELPMFVTS